MARARVLMAVVVVFAITSLTHAQESFPFSATGTVVTRFGSSAPLNRRPGDYDIGSIIAFVPKGTRVTIWERSTADANGYAWFHVITGDGKEGWLRADDVQLVEATSIPSSRPQPTVRAAAPGLIHEWRGSGSRATESFDVRTPEWRIRWAASGEQGEAVSVFLNVYAMDGTLVTSASGRSAGETLETIVHHGPGRYYLGIDASTFARWHVVVEELP